MTYKPPSKPPRTYQTIDRYRKRQRYGPIIMTSLAAILVIIGLGMIWTWLGGGSVSALTALFASDTPTPTLTLSPLPETWTPTPSPTPSETPTATIGPTDTAIAPFLITVQAGDTLIGLAEQHSLDPVIGFLIIMDYNQLTSEVLVLGQELIIPHPGAVLFTPTAIPPLPAGSEILYRVLPGDTVGSIAEKFLSTAEDIIEVNELADPNQIFVGQFLIVRIRLVTPTFGPSPTQTPTPGTPTPPATP